MLAACILNGGRGAEDGGESGDWLRTGDDAGSVTLSGLHLPFNGVRKPSNDLGCDFAKFHEVHVFVMNHESFLMFDEEASFVPPRAISGASSQHCLANCHQTHLPKMLLE